MTLAWHQPSHSGDNIVSYELYWNDTFSGEVSKLRYLEFPREMSLSSLKLTFLYYLPYFYLNVCKTTPDTTDVYCTHL